MSVETVCFDILGEFLFIITIPGADTTIVIFIILPANQSSNVQTGEDKSG